MNLLPSSTSSVPAFSSRHSVILADDRALTSLVWQLVERTGLSQTDLCKRMGVNADGLQRWKNGRSAGLGMTVGWLLRLAAACNARVVIEWME